jgi:alpha-tubulin suppressor-like RCC1 family protein
VRCWGSNDHGQLGDGTITERHTPVTVSGLDGEVLGLASGSSHTCALMSTGGVMCWGLNEDGQLGDGTTTDRRTPVDVVDLGSAVIAISLGGRHSCALLDTGGVQCWGHNDYGELGDGTTWYSRRPTDVSGLSGVVHAGVGNWHSCAIVSGGAMKCWGYNSEGQLGDGTTDDRTRPVDVVGLGYVPTAVTGGQFHTCALMEYGGVKCWGRGDNGELGNGYTADSASPVDVIFDCL